MKKIKYLLFFSVLITALSWICMVPIWQTPDEQSHFAQIAFLSIKGRNPGLDQYDTTEEIYISQIHLGTARDASGNNKFTFHPEYKIDYTNSLYGYYEASISSLVHTQAQSRLVISEASHYPILYYFPASILYRLYSSADIFTRIYTIRLYSLLFFLGMAIFSYKIGKLLFPDNKLLQMILTIFVSFHPMLLFSTIGVTSDSLANFLFTVFIYITIVLIQKGITIKRTLLLFVITLLSLLTKFQFITVIPMSISLILFLIFRDVKPKNKIFLSVLTLGISFGTIAILYFMKFQSLLIAINTLVTLNTSSFIKYTVEYTFPHTYKEVLPWYWGIYKWLGVTYPRFVHRIINYLLIFSLIGFVYWFLQKVIKKQWRDKNFQMISILIIFQIIYFGSISYYDWKSWYQTGYQLGVQGRYFFPFMTLHMAIITIGINSLLSFNKIIQEMGLKLLGLLMIVFNIYGFYTLANSYYDLSSIPIFIIQASQYKPWFIKGDGMILIFFTAIIINSIFIVSLLRVKANKNILKHYGQK